MIICQIASFYLAVYWVRLGNLKARVSVNYLLWHFCCLSFTFALCLHLGIKSPQRIASEVNKNAWTHQLFFNSYPFYYHKCIHFSGYFAINCLFYPCTVLLMDVAHDFLKLSFYGTLKTDLWASSTVNVSSCNSQDNIAVTSYADVFLWSKHWGGKARRPWPIWTI